MNSSAEPTIHISVWSEDLAGETQFQTSWCQTQDLVADRLTTVEGDATCELCQELWAEALED